MSAHQTDATTDYDGDLQMFRTPPHSLNIETLRFLRWLAERGKLEHAVAGPSDGHAALAQGIAPR